MNATVGSSHGESVDEFRIEDDGLGVVVVDCGGWGRGHIDLTSGRGRWDGFDHGTRRGRRV